MFLECLYPLDSYFYDKGLAYLDSANYTEAISFFTKAIILNSGNAICFYQRGSAFYNQEEYEKAIPDFKHCFDILPNEVAYAFPMSMCYDTMDNTQQTLMKLHPGNKSE